MVFGTDNNKLIYKLPTLLYGKFYNNFMKELIIKKGEVMIVYVYENGKQIDKFEIKVNVNDKLISERVK